MCACVLFFILAAEVEAAVFVFVVDTFFSISLEKNKSSISIFTYKNTRYWTEQFFFLVCFVFIWCVFFFLFLTDNQHSNEFFFIQKPKYTNRFSNCFFLPVHTHVTSNSNTQFCCFKCVRCILVTIFANEQSDNRV